MLRQSYPNTSVSLRARGPTVTARFGESAEASHAVGGLLADVHGRE